MTKSDWLITATPPTPNGDLHVGHLSGPYLAADIFKRARMALGDDAVYVSYGDDNQSYVLTTAQRLKNDPIELMDAANADIQRTLGAFQIAIDEYARPDEDHNRAVGNVIRQLVNQNLIIEKTVDELCDSQTLTPLYEAFVSGYCHICFLVTKGGICEACGHPNDPINLSCQSGTAGGNEGAFVRRPGKRLVLPIEHYREQIVEFYQKKRGVWRPHLIELVDELLRQPLADYPISHPSFWGIPIGLPGWSGHVVNVWAEMGIGLLHLLKRYRCDDQMRAARYVQFLGYDNSYFFAIVHPVLQFAVERAGIADRKLSEFIFTNEFCNLDNQKFSTSQAHAIWGRDLLEHLSTDEARFYLCLHSPELAESNFELSHAVQFVEQNIREPINNLRAHDQQAGVSSPKPMTFDPTTKIIRDRICFFSDPKRFSPSKIAKILLNFLTFLDVHRHGLSHADFRIQYSFLADMLETFYFSPLSERRPHAESI